MVQACSVALETVPPRIETLATSNSGFCYGFYYRTACLSEVLGQKLFVMILLPPILLSFRALMELSLLLRWSLDHCPFYCTMTGLVIKVAVKTALIKGLSERYLLSTSWKSHPWD